MTKNVFLTKFTCTVRMSVSNGNTPQFSVWIAVLFQFQNENKQTKNTIVFSSQLPLKLEVLKKPLKTRAHRICNNLVRYVVCLFLSLTVQNI